VEMPTLQDRAKRRQNPHCDEDQTEKQFRGLILRINLCEKFDDKPRQQPHYENVGNEDKDIEEQSSILFREEGL
jgi:hypothetical protein